MAARASPFLPHEFSSSNSAISHLKQANYARCFKTQVPFRIKCCEDTLGRTRVKGRSEMEMRFPEMNNVLRSSCPRPRPRPRPRQIILVRHCQSEGNVDESAYPRIPDHRICLTEKGWRDAEEVG
ncbi:hypothetical protein AMTRI_Chr09g36420 [Amborella trichopoda]